jgi:hypothetical protein
VNIMTMAQGIPLRHPTCRVVSGARLLYNGQRVGRRGRLRGNPMRYKPKCNAALTIALGGLPEQMRVEIDAGIAVSAKTVGQLRQVPVWPDNLVITTPLERFPESIVKVSKASIATRFAPKT